MSKLQARVVNALGDKTYVDLDAEVAGTNDDGSPKYKLAGLTGGGGGGGSGVDREVVVTTYLVKTAFTGASVGDTITCTQVIDVSGSPTTVSVIWRNQTTAADLSSVPSSANLTLLASSALTDAQLRATPVVTTNTNLDVALSTRLKPADTLAGINALGSITNALPSGTNVLGKVGIDQTTPGTTNKVFIGTDGQVGATQSGTWVVQPGNTANTTPWKVDGSSVTQPISATSLPLPSGAATSTKQPALGVAGTPSTDVITVQGIVSGTAIPVTDSILAADLGDMADAAASSDTGSASLIALTKRLLTKLTTGLPIFDGTQIANTIASDAGQNSLLVSSGRKEIPISITSGTQSAWYDVSNYAEIIIQVSNLGTGPTSASIQWSNDNGVTQSTSAALQPHGATNISLTTTMVTTQMYRAPRFGRYFRLFTNAAVTAGAFTAVVECFSSPSVITTMGVQLNGQAAHAAAIGSNPARIAGRAVTANYTAVTNGQTADLVSTVVGVPITRPYSIPEADWQFACATGGITNTTDVVVAGAAGAGLKNYCTGFYVANASSTVATEVVLKNGATVIWRGYLPASSPSIPVRINTPLQTSANAALNFACITTGAQVYFSGQGYIAP